jgi:peptide/nickel transport system substrate-binding protein
MYPAFVEKGRPVIQRPRRIRQSRLLCRTSWNYSTRAGIVLGMLCLCAGFASTAAGFGFVQDDRSVAQAELLQRSPFDRLTLADGTTFEIEPISPRPLPPPDAPQEPRNAGGLVSPTPKAESPNAGDGPSQGAGDELVIHLLEGDQRDFKVKRFNIRNVEYYEDMLLSEGERHVQQRKYYKAFEYYLAVQARNPTWKGLQDHFDRLLFEEGTWALASNDRDRGLRLLRELYDRNPRFTGLTGRLVQAYGSRVQEAIDKGMYPYARRVLHELETIDPENVAVGDLTARFLTRAREALRSSETASGGAKLDHLTSALRIWPKLEEAAMPFEESFRSLPTLEVGVVDLPRPVAPWVGSRASARVIPLIYLPILFDDSEEALIGKKPGQLAVSLELVDLGRRLDITLRKDLVWSDGSRQVSAIDVVRACSDRAQPRSPSYNARWADLLEQIETQSFDQVTIRLRRTPLDPIAWLTAPIGPAHAAWDGQVSTPEGRLPVGDGPYAFISQSDTSTDYQLNERATGSGASRGSLERPQIARVREIRLPDSSATMAAIVQGDVSLLEHVPADKVATLRATPDITLGRYRLPSLHCLAVDGRNPLLKNRNLRRAISYAINRQALLEETVLKRAIDEENRPSDGPFASDSYANASDVSPLEHDLTLAKMLLAGAMREMAATKVAFTLEYPASPEAQLAAPRIADALIAAGFQITLIQRPEAELEEALRSGRRFDLAYRVSRCDEPVREVGPLLCPGYDAPPESDGLSALASPRIMQLLLQMEHAPHWASARSLVTMIDRESRDELPIIPLWQLQDHFAYRTRLKGPQEVADYLYQGIEQWEVEPWFAKDPW